MRLKPSFRIFRPRRRIRRIRDEFEEFAMRHAGGHAARFEEGVDVDDVAAQKVHRVRVVVLDGLRHVDENDLAVEDKEIELRQIAVDEAADLEHSSHSDNDLVVALFEGGLRQTHVLETRRGPALRADELHCEDVLAQQKHARARHAAVVEAVEVAALLLGPRAHHLAGIALAVALEAVLAGDVLFPVLEDEDRRLVDLEGDRRRRLERMLRWRRRRSCCCICC